MKLSIPLILMLVLLSATVSADLTDELIGYWTFDNDETVGNVALDSQGNINGTLVNNVIPNQTGKIKESYGFGIPNDDKYVNLGVVARPSGQEFSVQVWAKSNATSIGGCQVCAGTNSANDWIFDQSPANFFRAQVNTDTGVASSSGISSPPNIFYHLILVYNSSRMLIYRNSILERNLPLNGTIVDTGQYVAVGAYSTILGSTDFAGVLDEVGIWNRSLTTEEVEQLYNNGTGFPFPFDVAAEIVVNTYNVTSATANATAWRTNQSFPVPTNDTTPTVKFSLEAAGNCTIGTQNLNFTDALTGDSNRLCGTLDSIEQTCTLPSSDPVVEGIDLIYLSCVNTNFVQTNESTSGALTLNTTIPPLPPPTNITGNFSCLIQDDICINGEFKCLLAIDGNGNEIDSKEAFNISCSSINIDNTAFLAIFYIIALVLMFLGARFRSPMLGVIGSMIGAIVSITFLFKLVTLSIVFIMFFAGIGIAFMFSMVEK